MAKYPIPRIRRHIYNEPMNTDWYFIPLALLVLLMIGMNEAGFGIFALFLLFPAAWLMFKAFENTNG